MDISGEKAAPCPGDEAREARGTYQEGDQDAPEEDLSAGSGRQ